MKEIISVVDQNFNDIKILDYLKKSMHLTSTLIKRVKYGGVFINGINVHMRAIVHNGDEVLVKLEDDIEQNIKPVKMALDIVYEDDYFIAINKPSGIPTHPSRGNHLPTLAEGVIAHFSHEKFTFRAINRLDRDTSGIVIIAKDQFSCSALSNVMKQGGFTKTYTAYVSGIPTIKNGTINAPIAREEEGNIKRVVRDDGKVAITKYSVIDELKNGNSICEINLLTGRTHQIRVHMAYIGHPLVDDFLYGEKTADNYFLHAKRIEFVHPITGKQTTIEAKRDLPDHLLS